MASHTESIAFRVFLVLNVGEGFRHDWLLAQERRVGATGA
jgi:hypothetical protein